MTTYLLLRDNKQSGPYTFDELKEKGLKAYDLVWLEGKSAAWRYPSEIEELSPFAPVVEEQPFDRFYKKPSQISNVRPMDNEPTVRSGNNTSVTHSPERTSSDTVVAASVISGDTSSVPRKRIIYVTLPAGRTPSAPRETISTLHEKYLPDHMPPAAPGSTVSAIEENPSQHNEDWRSGVEITPRAAGRHRTARIGQSFLVGLTVVALLAAGIFIGLSINKDSLGFVKNRLLNDNKDKPASVTASPADHPSQPLAINVVPPTTQVQDPAPAHNKDSLIGAAPKKTAAAIPPATRKSTSLKDRSMPATQKSQVAAITLKDADSLAVPAVHRDASHRTDMSVEKVDKDVIRNNLSNLVSIGATRYTVGTFGGISDLQLTVSNHSLYSLDLVVVEVQYIQANKKVFKTENLYFRGVAPGSALMQQAPKSTRGIKVQYKITLVNSKELGLSYSAL
jgi:hypothetical protein